MAGFASGKKSRRRTINEINMVPFIDVMLVLLVIFMVTAPMLTPGVINTPSIGKADKPPAAIAQVIVNQDGSLIWKIKSGEQAIDLNTLGAIATEWQEQQAQDDWAIVIAGDMQVQYKEVMDTLGTLQDAGIKKVAFLVKQGK